MSQLTLTDQTPRVAYTVGGSPQDAFAVPFAFFATSDLDVYVGGVLKTISVDYTVSGTSADDGYSSGTVTLTSPVSSTDVVIERDLPIEKTANFPTGSSTLNIRTLNTQLTKIFAILQQVRSLWTRAVRLSASDTRTALELPTAAEMANKYLAGSSDGSLIVAVGSTPPSVPVSSFAATLLDDADAAAARATLGAGTGNGSANYPTKGADIASASTLTLSGDEADQYFNVTGTTTVTAISTRTTGRTIETRFAGVLQLTHNASTLALITGANITTAAGDVARWRSEGPGAWRMVGYERANGQALSVPAAVSTGTQCVMNPYTGNATQTQAHGLGAAPTTLECYLECLTAEHGYSIGDRIPFSGTWADGGAIRFSVAYDATNVSIITKSTGSTLTIVNKSTRADATATSANWKVVVVPRRIP